MQKFDMSKKGYDPKQVDDYINNLTLKYEEKLSEQKDRIYVLKNENRVLEDRLNISSDKDKQVSKALLVAVEKAEEIETNAKKIYDLEMKRIKILYEKWQVLIKSIEDKYPNVFDSKEFASKLNDFKSGVKLILEKQEDMVGESVKNELKKNSDNYIKNLLNRMDYAVTKKAEEVEIAQKIEVEHKQEKNRLSSISKKLSAMAKVKPVSIADDYLNSEDDNEFNAYSKNIARKKYAMQKKTDSELGIDIEKEALVPKEDLSDIMKSFLLDSEDE